VAWNSERFEDSFLNRRTRGIEESVWTMKQASTVSKLAPTTGGYAELRYARRQDAPRAMPCFRVCSLARSTLNYRGSPGAASNSPRIVSSITPRTRSCCTLLSIGSSQKSGAMVPNRSRRGCLCVEISARNSQFIVMVKGRSLGKPLNPSHIHCHYANVTVQSAPDKLKNNLLVGCFWGFLWQPSVNYSPSLPV
jgi:hypothetical protein